LGKSNEANAAPPASEPGIASEELVELSVSGAAEALEIGLVERFIGACRIACQLEVPPRYGEHLKFRDNQVAAAPPFPHFTAPSVRESGLDFGTWVQG
jgi:hypothetical protein